MRRSLIDRYRPLFLKLLTVVAVSISLAYLGISWFVADRLTRPERYPLTSDPGDLGLAYESVEFESAEHGLTLRGWWIPSQDSDRAVILVHGRSSNRSGYDPQPGATGGLLRQAGGIVERGYSVLSFDLRGHGESDGVRYSMGWLERRDVRGAIVYVQSRGIPVSRIGLVCHSMGAATCLLTAAEEPDLAGVVADSPYARLTDLLAVQLPEASGVLGRST